MVLAGKTVTITIEALDRPLFFSGGKELYHNPSIPLNHITADPRHPDYPFLLAQRP